MSRVYKECIWILFILFLIIIQSSVIVSNDLWNNYVNIILLSAIFLGIYGLQYRAIYLSILGGYFIDYFSILPFGIILFAYIFSITILVICKKKIFKNDAIHAYLLNAFIALFSYHFIMLIALFICTSSRLIQLTLFTYQSYIISAFYQICIQIIILSLIFIIDILLQKKFVIQKHAK